MEAVEGLALKYYKKNDRHENNFLGKNKENHPNFLIPFILASNLTKVSQLEKKMVLIAHFCVCLKFLPIS